MRHTAPTADQIETFVKNLRESLLSATADGQQVVLNVKHDNEPITDEYGVNCDTRFMGCEFVVLVGRPALRPAA